MSVTFSIGKYHNLTFTFCYHDLTINYTIDEPYLHTQEEIENEFNKKMTVEINEGAGKGDERLVEIKLPLLFLPLYKQAVAEAFKDPRVSQPCDD